ncbi:serine/Arginine-related protein 53 isoform X1 [Heterodontus francisci]|uniref:serine/Arginine-related protein 53 isoform X1 n=1 Tax=Heterodontus francisci TaxID=7792 RepID=UPI00355B26D5
MGHHSSDSEDDTRSRRKKKHRRKSTSSSSSDSRTFTRKKSRRTRSHSRSHRSHSRSKDRRHRRRSSSSSSYEVRKKRSSRSRSRDRGKSYRSRRSRSRSRNRSSRSRHRQRSRSRSSERSTRRRSYSQSRSRERERWKGRDKGREKDRDKEKEREPRSDKKGDSANIKVGLEHLPPAEQAKARLQLVLQAAVPGTHRSNLNLKIEVQRNKFESVQWTPTRTARLNFDQRLYIQPKTTKADEVLKAKERKEEDAKKKREQENTIEEQVKRVKSIEAIESDFFVQQTFRSGKDIKKAQEPIEAKHESTVLSNRATDFNIEIKQEIDYVPSAIKYQDDDTLAHPSLFMDKKEAEEKWFKRLITLRQEKLMGSPVSGF